MLNIKKKESIIDIAEFQFLKDERQQEPNHMETLSIDKTMIIITKEEKQEKDYYEQM